MLKNIVKLECIINEKTYQLLCDQDSPLNCLKEALFQFSKYVGDVEESIRKQQEALAPTEPVEPKEEEQACLQTET